MFLLVLLDVQVLQCQLNIQGDMFLDRLSGQLHIERPNIALMTYIHRCEIWPRKRLTKIRMEMEKCHQIRTEYLTQKENLDLPTTTRYLLR